MTEIINPINWDSLVGSLQPELFNYHGKIKSKFKDGDLSGNLIEDFELKLIWSGEGRVDWIKRIRENSDLGECLEACKSRLNEKYNATWLKRYHNLYYGIKNDGYKVTKSPIIAIKLKDEKYYRMDGTHRSSVLFDLGVEQVGVLVFEFEDIRANFPVLDAKYEQWVLENYQNYQKFDKDGESRIKDRYANLVEITRKYFSGKTIGDVGCNAGYLSILLANDDGAISVSGFDISELDIAAAEVHAKRRCNFPEKMTFHLGHAMGNLSRILGCEVLFFIRSIYHLGNDANTITKAIKPGTTVIIECNKGHKKNLPDPDKVEPRAGKRLALKINLVPYLEMMGFRIEETLKNVDDVVIAVKI